ncbi:DRTGG domain-containing protein [Anaerorhabdus sp.]|uniref:DRTGG domain-containing protein n=1 Tax=Anaerorhabdus sp. TaxID=1872524 RepID=UPI002FC98D54
MKVSELVQKTGWNNISTDDSMQKEITGVYVGDLLSWVMGKGEQGQAWITVQSHINVIAVAVLLEFSCVIIADEVSVPDDVLAKAKEENLAIITTNSSSYECTRKLIELGL